MQYLEKAPKSPQKGAPSAPIRPSHYYNYAKHNNPTSNPMQYPNITAGRNPYATNPKALPEDKTIEDIDSPGTGNTSSLLTILLIGLTVIIILAGGSVGGYFLFRHAKSNKQTAKSKEESSDSSEEIASHGSQEQPASYESEETAQMTAQIVQQGKTKQNIIDVTSDITDTILVYQIYFNNVRDQEEFVGYTPQNQLSYNSLLSLEDIAKIFQSNGWNKEKGMMNNELRNGLCEYFEYNVKDIGSHDLANAERLCSSEYRLTVYPHYPLMFYVLSDKYQYIHQLGVQLSFELLIFQMNNQLYSLNHHQLQEMLITPSVRYARRRLIASSLPLERIILEKKQIWTKLPYGYNGKSYRDWEHAASYAHTMQPDIHIAHGAQFAFNDVNRDPNAPIHHLQFTVREQHRMHSDSPQQRAIDEQEQSCDEQTLNELLFVELEFTLTIDSKDIAATTWNCHYAKQFTPHAYSGLQSPWQYRSREYFRRQMMDESRPVMTAASQSDSVDSVKAPHEPILDAPEMSSAAAAVAAAAVAAVQREPKKFGEAETQTDTASIYEPPEILRAGAASAAAAPDATENDIHLNDYWLENILNNDQTMCSRTDCSDDRPCEREINPCKIIGVEVSELQRLETPDDNCDCYDACGKHWQATKQGTTLEMLQCALDIYATDFHGILQYPVTYLREPSKEFLFGRTYNQDERKRYIYTTGIPYWRCKLLKHEDYGAGSPVRTSPHLDEPIPRAPDFLEPIARTHQQVRRLAIDADTSRAWSKDNMFMIIASTIFFILIGIQSFYWLSHSF